MEPVARLSSIALHSRRRQRGAGAALLAAALVLSLVGAARPAAAQELAAPGPRQGYYFGVATQAAGSINEDDDIGTMRPMWGGGVSLRTGQMLTEWLGLGLQINQALLMSPRWQGSQMGLLLDAQLVPAANLVLRLGAGLGVMQIIDRRELIDELKGSGGPYYNASISYDLFPWFRRPSGGLSVAPVVQVSYVPGDSFRALTVWVGIETLWWAGLPKNELDLPVEDAFAP